MTCIAGISTLDGVWIGGDSAGVGYSEIITRGDPKVFTNGPFLFGITGSFRMGQLLRYKLRPPKRPSGMGVDRYLATHFIDAVRTCYRDGGFLETKDGAEIGGCFLLGYGGRLYYVDSDFQVGSPKDGIWSVGAGSSYALGALYASVSLTGKKTSAGQRPEKKLRLALEASTHYSTSVCGPYLIKNQKLTVRNKTTKKITARKRRHLRLVG